MHPSGPSAEIVLPIGHCIGVRHEDVPAGSNHANQIRVGADVLEPPDSQFMVWALAHGLAEKIDGGEACTVEQVRGIAGELEVLSEAQVDDCLDALTVNGLIVRVRPDAASARQFARQYRLVPLTLGLGPRPDSGGLFGIGLLYQPFVLLSPALAELWQFSTVAPDLWSACQDAAASAEAAGMSEPDRTEPGRVLRGAFDSVLLMLSTRVACFDVRMPVLEHARAQSQGGTT